MRFRNCLRVLSACIGAIALATPRWATGNGAPPGAHYNLNIIGVPKDKTADMTGNNGHRIFVKATGGTKIALSQGDAFQVLDANGTDGKAAFQLPNADPDNDGITRYAVYARYLGKPGGSATIEPTATDPGPDGRLGTADDIPIISSLAVVAVRNSGKSKFTDVSRQLLYIWIDIDGDGDEDRISLFDSRLQDYAWQYDNHGLKLCQLRFYEIPANVNP